MSETAAHDHELEVLEDDQNVPPRPEEQIADAPDDPEVSRSGQGSRGVDASRPTGIR
ncbi:hypothetical protein [Humibacillus xanthopallidus]|uniref:Uncharacterized protein n=1 Tax=Humibacillus xanthopallidus TaxID=412689 RepID=A0A543HWZ5_9MICO|nr:hypothetical protein [Humibacillus xanthopallidus]TQM62789.1 hypothetical protein FBY41_2827 [Humibacillus xanthopallidus]